jgi:hypothetical protein
MASIPQASSATEHHDSTHEKPKTSPDASTPTQFASIIPIRKEKQKESQSHDPNTNNNNRLRLEHTTSNISHHDIPAVPSSSSNNNDDSVYDRFPESRKRIITFVMAFSGFLAPISSTTVLSAVPEVAETYACDGAIVNLSNAM